MYFGFEDESYNIAVELFMKRYYQTIKTFNEINTMLLALLQEDILQLNQPTHSTNQPYFAHDNLRVTVQHPKIFIENPSMLLEFFLYFSEHEECKDISASTRRAIYQSRHLINQSFRSKTDHRKIFSKILALHSNLS